MLDQVDQQVQRGAAFYTKGTLTWYDFVLFKVFNPLIWNCRTTHLHDLYRTHMTGNHLDVGTGTGYFLDQNPFPIGQPRLTLMDLNLNCLELASRRLRRFEPETIQTNILEPIEYTGDPFDSISLTYLLHCLPGSSLREKSCVFDHLIPLLNPGGVIFGANVLQAAATYNPLTRLFTLTNNQKGIFCNRQDSYEDMHSELHSRFREIEIRQRGAVVLWSARDPIATPHSRPNAFEEPEEPMVATIS
jgi:predicted O-methyltransferase YrrM